MDKNTITAIVLMIVVVLGFSYWSSHNNENKPSPTAKKR